VTYWVSGRDLNPSEPWAVGSLIDIYPVLENIGGFEAEASEVRAKLNGGAVIDNPEAFARGAAQLLAAMDPKPRVDSRHGCDCSKKGRKTPLVKAYAINGGIWVWVRGNRIPNTAKRHTAHLYEADTLWPPNTPPYPRVTRCPRSAPTGESC
jgi:hypothetical protein